MRYEQHIKAIPRFARRALPAVIEALLRAEHLAVDAGITSDNILKQFIAQMAHESAGFKALTEYASGKAYDPPASVAKRLGNTVVGDGPRYKGRGIIQLTGKYNYTKYGKLSGLDLVNHPELAAEPDNAVKLAFLYWKLAGCSAPAAKGNFKEVTRLINGGYNGLADRKIWLDLITKHCP